MQPAPHVFIGVVDTTDARLPLATGIAQHLRQAIAAAGASVFQPLANQALPDEPWEWFEPIPGVCGHVNAPPGTLPTRRPDQVIAIRVRGGRATTQLEIFVIDGRTFAWSRHAGTNAAPSLLTCIAQALATANEAGGLGIPELCTLPELIAVVAGANGPGGALRLMEAKGRALIEQAAGFSRNDLFVGGPFELDAPGRVTRLDGAAAADERAVA